MKNTESRKIVVQDESWVGEKSRVLILSQIQTLFWEQRKILEDFCFVLFIAVLNWMLGEGVVTEVDLGVMHKWLKTVKFGPQLFHWFLHNLSAVFLPSNTWDLFNESSCFYDVPYSNQTGRLEVLQNVHMFQVKQRISLLFFQVVLVELLYRVE